MEKIDSITFIAYYQDLETKDFVSLEAAMPTKPNLIVKSIEGKSNRGIYTNQNYEFSFFNFNGEQIPNKITFGNWSISNLKVIGDQYFQHENIHFDMIDPKGVKKNMSLGKGRWGIDRAIKYLSEAAKFESIENYELKQENKKLREENESLKNRVTELQR